MRVVTFNLHAGVDGWGRRTEALATAIELAPDLLIAPETWRGDDGEDFVAALAEAGLTGAFAELARAERVTGGRGGRLWQPATAHLTGERGLFFTEHRALGAGQRVARDGASIERGAWGLGLFTRLPLDSVAIEPIERLPRERVRRAAIVARLALGGRPFAVVAVHGAHLSHGSLIQYRRVRGLVGELDPALPVILGGDFNSWRPPLRAVLPGWSELARARTWPGRHPHSQIDHLLARGPWRVTASGSRDGGSDHRALYADVELD